MAAMLGFYDRIREDRQRYQQMAEMLQTGKVGFGRPATRGERVTEEARIMIAQLERIIEELDEILASPAVQAGVFENFPVETDG